MQEKISLEEKPNILNISSQQDQPQKTKLSNKFVFYFRVSEEILKNQFPKQTIDSSEYESQVKKIAEFDTIEDFWAIYQHIKKPDNCKQGIEIQMFKENIKPMWEDESNKNGGKLTLKLNKGYTTIIWEELILGIIGNILPKETSEGINGIVFSSKKESNILQIWFKDYNKKYTGELEQCVRDLIQIPNEVPIDIKKFFYDDDIKKGSNYSNYNEKNDNNNSGYYGHKNDYYKNNKNKNK